MLNNRQEILKGDSGGSNLLLDWESLFFGRNAHTSGAIAIGPVHRADLLRIVTAPIESSDIERIAQMFPDEANRYKQDIRVIFGDCEQFIWSFFPMNDYPFKGLLGIDKLPPEAPCEQLGPGMLSEQDMARCWESVALTDAETQVIEALQLVSDSEVAGVTMVGYGQSNVTGSRQRPVVKLKSHDRPVPLKSLGDGAVRLFGVALAVANSRSGFLLIDEAENGIHHTVQRDLWKMVLQMAHANNVQVLATTHSWDCVTGFAQASTECKGTEGVLVRLDRDDRGLRVEYSEETLKTAAEQGIEVR